jgi:hypothetical protein
MPTWRGRKRRTCNARRCRGTTRYVLKYTHVGGMSGLFPLLVCFLHSYISPPPSLPPSLPPSSHTHSGTSSKRSVFPSLPLPLAWAELRLWVGISSRGIGPSETSG